MRTTTATKCLDLCQVQHALVHVACALLANQRLPAVQRPGSRCLGLPTDGDQASAACRLTVQLQVPSLGFHNVFDQSPGLWHRLILLALGSKTLTPAASTNQGLSRKSYFYRSSLASPSHWCSFLMVTVRPQLPMLEMVQLLSSFRTAGRKGSSGREPRPLCLRIPL